jgi:hypothetical protein
MEQQLNSERTYKIGAPVDYGSIYGYKKKKYPVIGTESEQTIGFVKEEAVVGQNGKGVGLVYYTRDLYRKCGQLRFYESPQAVIVAFGGQIAKGKVTRMKPATPRARAAAAKPGRVKKVA